MTTITGVRIGGDAIEFDRVSSTMALRHGRSAVDDGPLASSAALELVHVRREGTSTFRVGETLELDHDGGPAFRGRLTDATLVGDSLALTAIGALAGISRRPCGRNGFPAQLWADRVRAAFSDAGALDLLELELGPWNPPLVAVEPDDRRTLGGVLTGIADDVGAAIADTPDGRVLVQTIEFRSTLENAIANGDFSGGLEGWIPYGASTLELVGGACEVTRGTLGDWSEGVYRDWWPIAELDVAFTLRVRAAPGDRAYANVNGYTADGTWLAGADWPFTGSGDWQTLSGSHRLDPASQMMDFGVFFFPDDGSTFAIDDVVVGPPRSTLELPPETVLYAPAWAMVDTVANILELDYAGGTLTVSDASSVREFDPRPESLSTALASFADANRRAGEYLVRRASPDWVVSEATVLARVPVRIGQAAALSSLPPSSPSSSYLGVIEGWSDDIGGDEWRTTLALTAPRLSGLGVKWLDAVGLWSEAGSATWNDPSSLGAGKSSDANGARRAG